MTIKELVARHKVGDTIHFTMQGSEWKIHITSIQSDWLFGRYIENGKQYPQGMFHLDDRPVIPIEDGELAKTIQTFMHIK